MAWMLGPQGGFRRLQHRRGLENTQGVQDLRPASTDSAAWYLMFSNPFPQGPSDAVHRRNETGLRTGAG